MRVIEQTATVFCAGPNPKGLEYLIKDNNRPVAKCLDSQNTLPYQSLNI